MVYPRENRLLVVSRLLAVCVLSATSLRHVKAEDTTAVCTASSGDIAVGVQAIPDSACESGGLGCYSSTCRFCKYSETSKSSHLLECSGFGYDFVTLAPEPTPADASTDATSACSVSQGDSAVGIRAVTDASCANGGLGCYSDLCRFCKEEETPQSAHLLECSSFVVTEAPVIATEAPAVETPAPEVNTEAPNDGTDEPEGDTEAPNDDTDELEDDTEAPNDGTDEPEDDTEAPNNGTDEPDVDTEAPIDDTAEPIVDMATPAVETIVPVVDTVAPSVNATLATEEPMFNQSDFSETQCAIDESFQALGLDVLLDTTVTKSDIDYFVDGCRFCKEDGATEFPDFKLCSAYPWDEGASVDTTPETAEPVTPDTDTAAPEVVTPATETPVTPVVEAPASEAPATSTVETPATEAPTASGPVCSMSVSPGDQAAGIQIITDATCVNGGLGCIDSLCRFCKVTKTSKSAHLNDCSELLNPPTGPPTIPTKCTATLSVGDRAAGIQILTDTDCVHGGLGCFAQVCRFCKVTTTAKSAHLDDCSKYPNATTDTVFGQQDATGTTCSVDSGYKNIGIDVAVDSTVSATDDDYYTTGCRLCKLFDSAVSSFLTPCESLAGYGASTTPTCTQVVSPGDAGVGINITTDASCAYGGVGCISDICRFCKVRSTPQSSNFVSCSDIGATTTTTTTAAPVDSTSGDAIPLTCTSAVSGGDAAVGLDITTDPSCGDGGVGCVSSICRFCKQFNSAQSSTYLSCDAIVVPDMSSIKLVPIPAVTTATTDAPLVSSTLRSIDPVTGATVGATTAPATTAPATTAPATTAPATTAPATTAPATTAPATTAPATTAPATTAPATTAPATTAPATATPTTAAPVTAAPVTTAPVATTAAPATAAPTTAAPATSAPSTITCAAVSPGDAAVGLDIEVSERCAAVGGLGCIGTSGCKFCKKFETAQSSTYDYCAGYPAAASQLLVKAGAETVDTKLSSELSELLTSSPAAVYAVAAAACVGVVAAIAATVLVIKRAVRRLHRARDRSRSSSEDESERESGSVLADELVDSATSTGVSSEDEFGEV